LVVEYLTSTIDACVIYADGVLLLSHSVNALQNVFVDQFAAEFDLEFNENVCSNEEW